MQFLSLFFLTVWLLGFVPPNVRFLIFPFCWLVLESVGKVIVRLHTCIVWGVNLPESFTSLTNITTVPQSSTKTVKLNSIQAHFELLFFFPTFLRCRSSQTAIGEYYLLPQKAPWNGLHPLRKQRLPRRALDALHASQDWVRYYPPICIFALSNDTSSLIFWCSSFLK